MSKLHKGRYYLKKLNLQAPPFKARSEKETEELLHKYRVLARKEQILMVKLDNEIPWKPYDMLTYTNKESRKKLFEIGRLYLRLLLP